MGHQSPPVDVSSVFAHVAGIAAIFLLMGIYLLFVRREVDGRSNRGARAQGVVMLLIWLYVTTLAYTDRTVAVPAEEHKWLYVAMGIITSMEAVRAVYYWMSRDGEGQRYRWRHFRAALTVLGVVGAALMNSDLQSLWDAAKDDGSHTAAELAAALNLPVLVLAGLAVIALVWDFAHKTPSPEPAAGDDDNEAIDGAVVTATQWEPQGTR